MGKLIQLGRPRRHTLFRARHVGIDGVVKDFREARRRVKMRDDLTEIFLRREGVG